MPAVIQIGTSLLPPLEGHLRQGRAQPWRELVVAQLSLQSVLSCQKQWGLVHGLNGDYVCSVV